MKYLNSPLYDVVDAMHEFNKACTQLYTMNALNLSVTDNIKLHVSKSVNLQAV